MFFKRSFGGCLSLVPTYSCGARAYVAVHFTFRVRACAKSKAAQLQQQHQEKWKLSVSSLSFLQFFPPLKRYWQCVHDENASNVVATNNRHYWYLLGALEMSVFRGLSFGSYGPKECSKFSRSGYFVRKSIKQMLFQWTDKQHTLARAVTIYLVPVKDLDTSTLTAFLFAASEAGVLSSAYILRLQPMNKRWNKIPDSITSN